MGPDGSGKSTLLRLLSGVYSDHSGQLLIDDIRLRDYMIEPYRQHTGVLLSQQDIFEGTLLENITMGDESIEPSEIAELIHQIGIDDLLMENSLGFSTMLEPLGRRLSRSVVQKILLLRSLVNKPRLLLLEEPWRGLDANSRIRIQEHLLTGCGDATVFVESNDREFARRADQVLMFKDGSLVYAGPFHEGL
jgi:ABC-type bacteriocin/lantibiotic exporter with double-glycine peptidase domain